LIKVTYIYASFDTFSEFGENSAQNLWAFLLDIIHGTMVDGITTVITRVS
jgi:hypothetical protein